MKKKGFTLVELLAVIVILGIIMSIATPIIIKIINDSKKETYKLSMSGYVKAVEEQIAVNKAKGKITKNGNYNVKNFEVGYSGQMADKGNFSINNELVSSAQLCFDTYLVKYDGKEVTLTEKGCKKEANVNLVIGKKTYKNTVKDDIETEFNISDDISKMTNIVCNNGVTISMNDNALKLSDVFDDTNCTMSSSINTTFNNLDDTKNYVLMLKKDTIESKMTVGEKNKVTINLNGQNLTSNGSDSTSAFGISGELSIIGENSSIAGNMNSAEVTKNGILNIDGGSYNSIKALGNSKISIKNATLSCTNDGNNCYPIFAQNNSNVELDNVKVLSKGKAAGTVENSNMLIKNSDFTCTEDNCLYSSSIEKLTVLDTTIKASGYAVKLNNSGEVTIKNTKLESKNNNAVTNAGASGKIIIENSELISSNYRGVTLDYASNGSIDIYNSKVIGNDYSVLNNSNGGGVININGGTYISNDITIMNIHDGKININDKNGKVYIASYKKEGNTDVYKAKTIKNTANGVININGNVSDFCGKDDTKTTIGTCIYNEYGRAIVNDDTATGEIKISGGYIVSNNSSAVENFQGNISICGSKIDGKEADLKINKISTGDYGYIYYDVNTKLMNDTKIDRYNNPSHIVLTADLVCK